MIELNDFSISERSELQVIAISKIIAGYFISLTFRNKIINK